MAGATRKATSEMEELIDRKFKELQLTLASKQGIEDLRKLIIEQNLTIDKQNQEILAQAQDISNMKDQIAVLSNSVNILKSRCDDQEQYSRRQCLRLKGIKKDRSETPDSCVKKVVEVCENLNLDITARDIDRAHRVGKDKKVMIVKFFAFNKRTALYKNRKKEGPIKIHLDLTKHRLDLLDKAKSLITNSCNVDFVFGDINCNTVAKLKDNRFMFFDSIEKFKTILDVS